MTGSYREMTIAGKAAQRGIVEQRPTGGKSKRPRMVVVEMRYTHGDLKIFPRDWRKYGSYRTPKEAEAVIDQQMRKYNWMELRIRPPLTPKEAP